VTIKLAANPEIAPDNAIEYYFLIFSSLKSIWEFSYTPNTIAFSNPTPNKGGIKPLYKCYGL
jgi:hypothetical protein